MARKDSIYPSEEYVNHSLLAVTGVRITLGPIFIYMGKLSYLALS